MSMLSAQCDELRSMAESVGLEVPQAATLMMEAADTITELRGALQVASVDYRHLQDENAKLREEIEAAKHDLSLFSGELVASKLENAKLRELVKEMRVCLEDECKRCHEWGDACDIEHQMHKLGVEVD